MDKCSVETHQGETTLCKSKPEESLQLPNNKSVMIADFMQTAAALKAVKTQISTLQQTVRKQQHTINALQDDKATSGEVTVGLSVKADRGDVGSLRHDMHAMLRSIIRSLPTLEQKCVLGKKLVDEFPCRFTQDLLHSVTNGGYNDGEDDMHDHSDILKAHERRMKELARQVDKLTLQNQEVSKVVEEFKMHPQSQLLQEHAKQLQGQNSLLQLAQKRGDECAARLEQQEKELLQSTEEFKLKMEDLRHKTEEQIKAVLKETSECYKNSKEAHRQVETLKQSTGQLKEFMANQCLDNSTRDRAYNAMGSAVAGCEKDMDTLNASVKLLATQCDLNSTAVQDISKPLTDEIANMRSENQSLVKELQRHHSAFRALVAEFELHRDETTQWFGDMTTVHANLREKQHHHSRHHHHQAACGNEDADQPGSTGSVHNTSVDSICNTGSPDRVGGVGADNNTSLHIAEELDCSGRLFITEDQGSNAANQQGRYEQIDNTPRDKRQDHEIQPPRQQQQQQQQQQAKWQSSTTKRNSATANRSGGSNATNSAARTSRRKHNLEQHQLAELGTGSVVFRPRPSSAAHGINRTNCRNPKANSKNPNISRVNHPTLARFHETETGDAKLQATAAGGISNKTNSKQVRNQKQPLSASLSSIGLGGYNHIHNKMPRTSTTRPERAQQLSASASLASLQLPGSHSHSDKFASRDAAVGLGRDTNSCRISQSLASCLDHSMRTMPGSISIATMLDHDAPAPAPAPTAGCFDQYCSNGNTSTGPSAAEGAATVTDRKESTDSTCSNVSTVVYCGGSPPLNATPATQIDVGLDTNSVSATSSIVRNRDVDAASGAAASIQFNRFKPTKRALARALDHAHGKPRAQGLQEDRAV